MVGEVLCLVNVVLNELVVKWEDFWLLYKCVIFGELVLVKNV